MGIMVAHWWQPGNESQLVQSFPFGFVIFLFFILSGFLITRIVLSFKERNAAAGTSNWKSIGSFFARRILRIFPVYYVVLLLLHLIEVGHHRELWPWFCTHTVNIYMSFVNGELGYDRHFWTLSLEEQFYCFWLFALLLVPRKFLKAFIIIGIVGSIFMLYYLWMYTWMYNARYLLISCFHPFGLGAIIAYYEKYQPESFQKLSVRRVKWVLLSLAVFFLAAFALTFNNGFRQLFDMFMGGILCAIFTCVVLIAVKNGFRGVFKWLLENRVIRYLGQISYALYVIHMYLNPLYWEHIAFIVPFYPQGWQMPVTYFAISVGLASISWYAMERPINGLKRYFRY